VVERAAILCPGEVVDPSCLAIVPAAGGDGVHAVHAAGSDLSLEELERLHIRQVIARTDSLDAAARILGIDASTLYRKRKAIGLD
jgi:NtrC-family two-component system response regulator AlgB